MLHSVCQNGQWQLPKMFGMYVSSSGRVPLSALVCRRPSAFMSVGIATSSLVVLLPGRLASVSIWICWIWSPIRQSGDLSDDELAEVP